MRRHELRRADILMAKAVIRRFAMSRPELVRRGNRQNRKADDDRKPELPLGGRLIEAIDLNGVEANGV